MSSTDRKVRGLREQEEGVRIGVQEIARLMAEQPPGTTLEVALGVFEVFGSGALTEEVYVLEDVAGKRIAIAPRELKARYQPPAAR